MTRQNFGVGPTPQAPHRPLGCRPSSFPTTITSGHRENTYARLDAVLNGRSENRFALDNGPSTAASILFPTPRRNIGTTGAGQQRLRTYTAPRRSSNIAAMHRPGSELTDRFRTSFRTARGTFQRFTGGSMLSTMFGPDPATLCRNMTSRFLNASAGAFACLRRSCRCTRTHSFISLNLLPSGVQSSRQQLSLLRCLRRTDGRF